MIKQTKAETIDDITAQLEAARAEVERIGTNMAAAEAELIKMREAQPELASKVLQRAGDAEARDGLRDYNQRVLDLEDDLKGWTYDRQRAVDRVDNLVGRLAEAQRAERQAQLDRLRAARDEAVKQFAAVIRQAGAALAEAGHCQDEIGKITHGTSLTPDNTWRTTIARGAEGLVRMELDLARGRYPISLDIASRLTIGEATRAAAILAENE